MRSFVFSKAIPCIFVVYSFVFFHSFPLSIDIFLSPQWVSATSDQAVSPGWRAHSQGETSKKDLSSGRCAQALAGKSPSLWSSCCKGFPADATRIVFLVIERGKKLFLF